VTTYVSAVDAAFAIDVDHEPETEPRPPDGENAVSWLIERFNELDKRMLALQRDIVKMSDRWGAEIDDAKRDLQTYADRRVQRLADTHIGLRLWGLGYVCAGIAISWAANVV